MMKPKMKMRNNNKKHVLLLLMMMVMMMIVMLLEIIATTMWTCQRIFQVTRKCLQPDLQGLCDAENGGS